MFESRFKGKPKRTPSMSILRWLAAPQTHRHLVLPKRATKAYVGLTKLGDRVTHSSGPLGDVWALLLRVCLKMGPILKIQSAPASFKFPRPKKSRTGSKNGAAAGRSQICVTEYGSPRWLPVQRQPENGILTLYTSTLPCTWWCHLILVEKAMFQMGNMYLWRSPVKMGPFNSKSSRWVSGAVEAAAQQEAPTIGG